MPDVGRVVANLIDFMHANNRIDFGRTYLIGSSLGAHIAGFTGKQTQRGRVNTIIGSVRWNVFGWCAGLTMNWSRIPLVHYSTQMTRPQDSLLVMLSTLNASTPTIEISASAYRFVTLIGFLTAAVTSQAVWVSDPCLTFSEANFHDLQRLSATTPELFTFTPNLWT